MKKILLVLLFPVTVVAQKNISKSLEKYMQAQASVKGFTGTVLVMQHDKVLLKKGYGLADREWNVPNNTDTKFRIGSMTKQFTAACILQLAELDRLSLDDKLSKYYPDFPKGDSVTIQMLLSHTSGIADYTSIPGFEKVETLSWNRDSMISFFKNRPYTHSPGTKFKYSNSGYFLLGAIIEKVSGQSYGTYLQKYIFDVLDMHNTGIDRLDSIIPMHARGYSIQNKIARPADPISLNWPFSAGVLYSTTDDLYKWDRALYDNNVLSAAAKQKMFKPGKGDYGDGFIIDSLEGHYRNWHNGGIPGFLSNISRYTNDDLCVIVLANTDIHFSNTLSISDAVADGLAGIVLGLTVETPYVHTEVAIDPSFLDRYVGKYKAFLTLEVIKKDGKLYRRLGKSPDIELKPESNTKFFYDDDSDRQLEFEVDKDGKVTKIWFINNENRGEMTKVQ